MMKNYASENVFFHYFALTLHSDMRKITVSDEKLRQAATQGSDAFVGVFTDALLAAIDGTLTADNMCELNADQLTLIGWFWLHEEVMDGGFIQLIHNGYGPFFFRNPFAAAVAEWGLDDLSKLINKVRRLYFKYGKEIEADCSDDEFMSLFERYPDFDDADDTFVDKEELWTAKIAYYIDENIEKFAIIE